MIATATTGGTMATILIVEDDGLVARDMARSLRRVGHTPIRARDACAGLEEAQKHPDLVLLDLGLPDLPGEELLRRLRAQPETARIPVLVVTGRREAAVEMSPGDLNTGKSHSRAPLDACPR